MLMIVSVTVCLMYEINLLYFTGLVKLCPDSSSFWTNDAVKLHPINAFHLTFFIIAVFLFYEIYRYIRSSSKKRSNLVILLFTLILILSNSIANIAHYELNLYWNGKVKPTDSVFLDPNGPFMMIQSKSYEPFEIKFVSENWPNGLPSYRDYRHIRLCELGSDINTTYYEQLSRISDEYERELESGKFVDDDSQ